MPQSDPYLTQLYDGLHASPMQRKFRALAPMPVGVVFIEQPGMSETDIRGHLQLMKALGFTCLKQFMLRPGTDVKHFMHMALDEGIIPWWYDEAGWEEITPELLAKLELPPHMPVREAREHPRMRAYQLEVMHRRVEGETPPAAEVTVTLPPEAPFSYDMQLDPAAIPAFAAWLKQTYGSVPALYAAWNLDHAGNFLSGQGVADGFGPDSGWDQVADLIPRMSEREYRHVIDIIRFKSDLLLQDVRARITAAHAQDRNAPLRAGGEMGLFLPFASRATDMEGMAEIMREHGSFYPSIHLAWHFEENHFEVPRSVYMQASIAQDWFKGGWAATWESTGGPQQLSGGKGWTHEAGLQNSAFTVDDGVITQLMLSYLAAGFKGFGLWCWNSRSFGWEAGEYMLLDRNNQPVPRTIKAGQIGQAARRWRDEMWAAHKEPLVGIFTDYSNEMMWAAISGPNRTHYKHYGVQARIGVAHALTGANIPWEHVTASDLRAGLAGRYRAIYLPAVIAMGRDLQEILLEYVRSGGRLVMDLPSLWYDEYARLLPTGPGSLFEQTFGVILHDYQYSSNVPRCLHGRRLQGFVADIEPTTALVLAASDSGKPAVTEARVGQGSAVVLNYEAALGIFRRDFPEGEDWLVRYTLGGLRPSFTCLGALAYRLKGSQADHYFLINEGPTTRVMLDTGLLPYESACDAITGEALPLGTPILLPAYNGRWIRMALAESRDFSRAGDV